MKGILIWLAAVLAAALGVALWNRGRAERYVRLF